MSKKKNMSRSLGIHLTLFEVLLPIYKHALKNCDKKVKCEGLR